LGTVLRSNLREADQVNYIGKEAWKTLICIRRNRISNTKGIANTSLVSYILEYMAQCWDSFHHGPGVYSVSNRNEYQKIFMGDKAQPFSEAGNLIANSEQSIKAIEVP
jgi:hypothetical protein